MNLLNQLKSLFRKKEAPANAGASPPKLLLPVLSTTTLPTGGSTSNGLVVNYPLQNIVLTQQQSLQALNVQGSLYQQTLGQQNQLYGINQQTYQSWGAGGAGGMGTYSVQYGGTGSSSLWNTVIEENNKRDVENEIEFQKLSGPTKDIVNALAGYISNYSSVVNGFNYQLASTKTESDKKIEIARIIDKHINNISYSKKLETILNDD